MSDSKSVSLPTHLWDALDLMSQEMGVGRDELLAQAIFTSARLNGYIIPGRVQLGAGANASSPMHPTKKPGPPVPAPVARSRPEPVPEPEPESQPEASQEDDGNPFDENGNDGFNDEDLAPEEHDEDDAGNEDEPMPEDDEQEPPPDDEEEPEEPAQKKANLTMVMSGREPFKMAGDVITLGRGKACDFVIDSNRVSREHARILREGADFVLEDLNSSNGTFFGPGKEKITRPRKIKDGDEFTFGTEKVKFQIRK